MLDVGCGPGSLTLLLAPHVGRAIGVDADPDMLAEAARLARAQRLEGTAWRLLRAEELSGDLPAVDVVTFAQSLHWMDGARVLPAVRGLLRPGGAVVHVHAETHRGTEDGGAAPFPRPPWAEVTALVERHLGARPRAGRGFRPAIGGGGEAVLYRAAGFRGPQRLTVPGETATRTVEQVLDAVHSLSSAAPALFGDRLADVDAELRDLLTRAACEGLFTERMPDVDLDVWR
nr:class I SAM-dependent methyltransferase [Kineococcus siccus]